MSPDSRYEQPPKDQPWHWGRYILNVVLLTIAYGVTAWLSQRLSIKGTILSPIWPPTGIAIAAVWIGGYRLWPAIAIAMLINNADNFLIGENFQVAQAGWLVLVAIGDAMEPVIAVYLLRRFARPTFSFDRRLDAFGFMLAVVPGTIVSATVGVIGVCVMHPEKWVDVPWLWFTWFVSNTIGGIVLAPLIIVFVQNVPRPSLNRVGEAAMIVAFLVVVSAVAFLLPGSTWWNADYRLEYLTVPFMLWAVFRFRVHGAVVATLLVTAIGVGGTIIGRGAFAVSDMHASLTLVQIYLAVVTVMALTLAGALSEQRNTLQQLKQHRDHLDEVVRERSKELSTTVERLRSSENRYRLITDHIPSAVAYVSHDLRYLFVNRVFCEWLGGSPGSIVGQPVKDVLPPEMFSKAKPQFDRALRGETTFFELKAPSHVSGGRWLEIVYVPDYEDSEHVVGFYAMAYDVTDRKTAEQRLQAYSEALERSNRELQDFAYVASHDLQEPLRKIKTFADRIAGKSADRLDEKSRDYLERMCNATGRMQGLIDDLLEFSRVATKVRPFQAVDLDKLVKEVIGDLEVLVEQSGGCVDVEPLGVIDGDPMQMRRLFQNLISNAFKFRHPDRTPIVHVSRQTPDDAGSTGTVATHCRLIVEDNGIGFEAQYAERIFHVFQRLHGRSEYEGTGIGLAICRKIVERHSGTITAEGRPGEGATFIVDLPTSHLSDDSAWS